jgi:hypothetical protein
MPQKLDWKVLRFKAIKQLNKAVATHMAKHKIPAFRKEIVYKALFKKLDKRTQELIKRKPEVRGA